MVVEDTKGFETALFKWKRKHFVAQYGFDLLITNKAGGVRRLGANAPRAKNVKIGTRMPVAELAKLVRYEPETGRFYWLARSPSDFGSARGYAISVRRRPPGSEALNVGKGAGYLTAWIDGYNYYAHAVGWALTHGDWAELVDHIDGDRQNNKLSNLRAVTKSENAKNMKRFRTNTSGVTGVALQKSTGKWIAQIGGKKDGSSYIGSFDKFEDAVAARKEAEKQRGFHPNHGRLVDGKGKIVPYKPRFPQVAA